MRRGLRVRDGQAFEQYHTIAPLRSAILATTVDAVSALISLFFL